MAAVCGKGKRCLTERIASLSILTHARLISKRALLAFQPTPDRASIGRWLGCKQAPFEKDVLTNWLQTAYKNKKRLSKHIFIEGTSSSSNIYAIGNLRVQGANYQDKRNIFHQDTVRRAKEVLTAPACSAGKTDENLVRCSAYIRSMQN